MTTAAITTEEEFDTAMERDELTEEYADYLVRVSDARIGNGTALIEAMEGGQHYEEFKEWYLK
jgi:hypothetical protein